MSEDTVMAVKRFLLPLRIIWIKELIFFHHGPRDMQEFPSGGTSRHFLGFARFTSSLIQRFDHGVQPGRSQGSHVQSRPQAPMTALPNRGPMPDTRSGLPGHRRQSGIGRE